MFHTWNVKQFRPSGLQPYDYTRENYTDLLWVAEGTTSYFDDLLLVRSGIESADWYLDLLTNAITAQRRRPGSFAQSLAESSFDAWIKFSHAAPHHVNSTVSFYEAGALASLLLDLEMRRRTGNRVWLDHVMREMYRRFPRSGPGYTVDDLRHVIEGLSQTTFKDFFDRYIFATEALPFETAFPAVGLVLKEVTDAAGYAGLSMAERSGKTEVHSVLSDGPAFGAGVNAGDEIVAVDDRHLSALECEAYLARRREDDVIRLVVLRRGRLRRFDVKLSRGRTRFIVERSPEATEAQRKAYESWLEQPWPCVPAREDFTSG
jgi:predicted metalloprotease with PDZ domain